MAVEEFTQHEVLEFQGWPRVRPWVEEFKEIGKGDEVIQAERGLYMFWYSQTLGHELVDG